LRRSRSQIEGFPRGPRGSRGRASRRLVEDDDNWYAVAASSRAQVIHAAGRQPRECRRRWLAALLGARASRRISMPPDAGDGRATRILGRPVEFAGDLEPEFARRGDDERTRAAPAARWQAGAGRQAASGPSRGHKATSTRPGLCRDGSRPCAL
jgi:hypothetical protein